MSFNRMSIAYQLICNWYVVSLQLLCSRWALIQQLNEQLIRKRIIIDLTIAITRPSIRPSIRSSIRSFIRSSVKSSRSSIRLFIRFSIRSSNWVFYCNWRLCWKSNSFLFRLSRAQCAYLIYSILYC